MENLNFALRYLRTLRGGSVTRIISLSLGLAVGLLLFSYVNFKFSVNRCIRDNDRIYQLWAHYSAQMGGFSDMLNGPVAPTLMAQAPQVECATRVRSLHDIFECHDHRFEARMLLADTCFFDLFGFSVEQGDPHRVLADPAQVMISRTMARRAFGSLDPVGKLLITGRVALPAVTLGAVAGRCGSQFIVENFVDRVVLHWWLFALAAAAVLAFSIGVHCLRTRSTALSSPLEIIRDDLNE